jgi:hypothetical protein
MTVHIHTRKKVDPWVRCQARCSVGTTQPSQVSCSGHDEAVRRFYRDLAEASAKKQQYYDTTNAHSKQNFWSCTSVVMASLLLLTNH